MHFLKQKETEPIGYKLAIILRTNVTQIDFHDFRDMTVRCMSFA